MSSVIPGVRKLQNKLTPDFLKFTHEFDLGRALVPDAQKPPPGPPTFDEAARNVAESDRMRRRRGVYANIFAGNAAAPTVGKTTLGG